MEGCTPLASATRLCAFSVSAAICMYELSRRIRHEVKAYQMDPEEKKEVYFNWLKNTVQKSDYLIKEVLLRQK